MRFGHPDSLSFVIHNDCDAEEGKRAEKHSRGFFSEIINAFIDSIKMKDYCIAVRSFALCVFFGELLLKSELGRQSRRNGRLCMMIPFAR